MSDLLNRLRNHINGKSVEELQNLWKKAESHGYRGPNAYDYLAYLKDSIWCGLESPPITESSIVNIETPNFGVFFLVKIVPWLKQERQSLVLSILRR